MEKIIAYGTEVRNKCLAGATMMRDIVASTFGPEGHNVIIENGGVRPVFTKDGATAANAVSSDDPYKKIGIATVKDVVSRVDELAGDGTTTTTIYTTGLLERACKLVDLGVNANGVRKGITRASEDAVKILREKAEKTTDVASIASVASNGNEEITKLLTEAYNSIGDNGTIAIATSYKRSGESYVELDNGIKWEGGIPSPLFVTNSGTDAAEIYNPYIMVFASGIKDLKDLEAYVELAKANSRPLVLVAPYFEPELFTNAAARGIFMLMSPGKSFSHLDLHEALMDFAVAVGTKVIPDTASALKVCPDLKDLGVAKSIVSSMKETNVTQVEEFTEEQAKAFEDYVNALKKSLNEDDTLTPTIQELLRDRIAKLSGGIATIRVGAPTPAEMEEKLALYQDAQNSVATALKYGILPGGGTALLKVAQTLADTEREYSSEAEKKGYEVVLSSMRELAQRLIASVKPNDYQYIVQQIAHKTDFWTGYNVRTQKEENLKKSKIFDSAAIEITAVERAASAVGSFIISDGVIVNKVANVNYDFNDRKAKEIFG